MKEKKKYKNMQISRVIILCETEDVSVPYPNLRITQICALDFASDLKVFPRLCN